jgi:ABC-type nitrate/sulfonate/bicarbonate transport system permease component
VSRSSWFAIRAPLSTNRATVAKCAAFLLPLASWALLCLVWVPDVLITDQGNGPYSRGQRVSRADFESVNEQIREQPPVFRLSDSAWQSLKTAQLPAPTLMKLEAVSPTLQPNGDFQTLSWLDQQSFLQSVRDEPDKTDPDLDPYLVRIWNHLEKETRQPEVGEPSTVVWLPSPWRVASAFCNAFVTPPNGTGYKLTSDSIDALRKDGVPEPVLSKLQGEDAAPASVQDGESAPQPVSSKPEPLLGKFFPYAERSKFEEQLGEILGPDELHEHKKQIVKRSYLKGEPWLHESLWHSCQIIFWGFIFSAIVGVPLGILCGTFDFFSKLTEPFIDFVRYMPAPAFGVLCVAILGLDNGPKIAIIWIGTFFQMVLVVANTTRQFDPSLLEAAQTLGATKRTLLAKVILPGILPNLYNDMRILIGWAWTYLIVAELIGAPSGISEFINREGLKYRNFDKAYAGIIMIGIIGLSFDQLLATLSRFLFPWVPRSGGSGAWGAFFGALSNMLRGGRKSSALADAAPARAQG